MLEYIGYIISIFNIIICICYVLPQGKKLRPLLFISLIFVNSLALIKSAQDILNLLLIIVIMFEFFVYKLKSKERGAITQKSKINYITRLMIAMILVLIGYLVEYGIKTGVVLSENSKTVHLTNYDYVAVFIIIIVTLNSLIGLKKWNG